MYQKLAGLTAHPRRVLVPGARLPSERRLAEALTLSRTTVVAAYDSLHEAGWVDRRAGSSTRVSPVARGAGGARRRQSDRACRARSSTCSDEDHGLVDFGRGLAARQPGARRSRVVTRGYAAAMGTATTIRSACRVARGDRGVVYGSRSRDRRPTGAGDDRAQQAINLCAMAYLQRGDTVLVEDPYFGALDAFRLAGAGRLGPRRSAWRRSDAASPHGAGGRA